MPNGPNNFRLFFAVLCALWEKRSGLSISNGSYLSWFLSVDVFKSTHNRWNFFKKKLALLEKKLDLAETKGQKERGVKIRIGWKRRDGGK